MKYTPTYRGYYDSVAEARYYEDRPHLQRIDGSSGFNQIVNKVLTDVDKKDTLDHVCDQTEQDVL